MWQKMLILFAAGQVALWAFLQNAHSQTVAPAPSTEFKTNMPDGAANIAGLKRLTSNFEFWLSICVLLFAVFVITLQYRLVTRRGADFDTAAILRMTLITPIIMGTVFFVTAGFDSQQIAPAMGLFGTIAGYILGREVGRQEDQNASKSNRQADEPQKT
jgi:Trk-type K+ transport system membrane component